MTDELTPTPRTDKLASIDPPGGSIAHVYFSHARQLERELSAALSREARIREALEKIAVPENAKSKTDWARLAVSRKCIAANALNPPQSEGREG
jgi:hypothetical protein